MLLQLGDISKVFDLKTVFKSVSFILEAGQILLLTGPNGSGKSTLLKIICGLTSASSGKISLELKQNENIAFMGFQSSMYPELSALENLSFWNRFYGLSRKPKRITEVLELVNLGPATHEKAGNLSSGMLKRLDLARALLLCPALLLLDEPEAGLDSVSQELLVKEIAGAAGNGSAVIWVSHAPEKLAPYARFRAELRAHGQNKFSKLTFFDQAEEPAKHPGNKTNNFRQAEPLIC
jgi:heme exporter protein A